MTVFLSTGTVDDVLTATDVDLIVKALEKMAANYQEYTFTHRRCNKLAELFARMEPATRSVRPEHRPFK